MFPYIFLGALSSLMAFIEITVKNHKKWLWILPTLVVAVIIIGLRYEVGGDWNTYVSTYEVAKIENFREALLFREPAYMLANIIPAYMGIQEIWGANLICAVILCSGLAMFCIDQRWPALAICAATPYFLTVAATGYSRQAVAVGCTLFAISALTSGNKTKFFLWCLVAAAFHKTAVIFACIGMLSLSRSIWVSVIITALSIPPLFAIFLMESIDRLEYIYIERQYESVGAVYRSFQLFLCGLTYLIFLRKRNDLSNTNRFWTICAVIGMVTLPASIFGPSSTMIDRFGLFLLPMQFFVLSNIPHAFSPRWVSQAIGFFVIGINFSLLIIWLSTANRLTAFIPYKSYIW